MFSEVIKNLVKKRFCDKFDKSSRHDEHIIAPVGIAPESNAEEALLDGSGGRNIRSVVGKNRDFSQNFFRFVRPS